MNTHLHHRKHENSLMAATKTRITTDYTDDTDKSRNDQINLLDISVIRAIRGKTLLS